MKSLQKLFHIIYVLKGLCQELKLSFKLKHDERASQVWEQSCDCMNKRSKEKQTLCTFTYQLPYTPTHTPHLFPWLLYLIVSLAVWYLRWLWSLGMVEILHDVVYQQLCSTGQSTLQIDGLSVLCTCSVSFQKALLCCLVCTVTTRQESQCMPMV